MDGLFRGDKDGQRVEVQKDKEEKLNYGAVAACKDSSLYVLVYSHNPRPNQPGEDTIDLTIGGERIAGAPLWSVDEQLFDRENGIYVHEMYKDIEAAGIAPVQGQFYLSLLGFKYKNNMTEVREIVNRNRRKYQKLSEMQEVGSGQETALEDGTLNLELQIKGSGFRFFKLTPR